MASALRCLSKVPRGDVKVQNSRSSLVHLRAGLGHSRRFDRGSFGHRRLKIACDANPDPAEAFVHVATTIKATGKAQKARCLSVMSAVRRPSKITFPGI